MMGQNKIKIELSIILQTIKLFYLLKHPKIPEIFIRSLEFCAILCGRNPKPMGYD